MSRTVEEDPLGPGHDEDGVQAPESTSVNVKLISDSHGPHEEHLPNQDVLMTESPTDDEATASETESEEFNLRKGFTPTPEFYQTLQSAEI